MIKSKQILSEQVKSKKKIRLPEVLVPLLEKAKKYKSAKEFAESVYDEMSREQYKQIAKLTDKGYGIGAYKEPAINAPKDFYNLFVKGKLCIDL